MRLVFQFPASMTSVVDAPRLVSSDASPTRPECAVTRLSTPATCAAAVNRNPIICADNGTTRLPGSGLVAPRNVRRARATPSFTNRTSFTSPSWFVLLRRTVTRTPSPAVESTTSAQRSALTSLRRMPAMKSNPAITASTRPRSRATSLDSTPRPRRRGRWQVASTAARSEAPKGCAWPRPRSLAVLR